MADNSLARSERTPCTVMLDLYLRSPPTITERLAFAWTPPNARLKETKLGPDQATSTTNNKQSTFSCPLVQPGGKVAARALGDAEWDSERG